MNLLLRVGDRGLGDYYSEIIGRRDRNRRIRGEDFRPPKIVLDRESDENWVVFLPWMRSFEEMERFGLLPKNVNYLAYQLQDGIANPDPERSKDMHGMIVRDFSRRISLFNGKGFGVLTFSAGQFPGVFIANHFGAERLRCVCPGSNLGEVIWKGLVTQEVRRRAVEDVGVSDWREYDSVLEGLNPMENLDGLPERVEVILGEKDRYVPIEFGRKFVYGVRSAGKICNVKRYDRLGHVGSVLRYGREQEL